MRKFIISVVISVVISLPIFAQKVNSDSIKAEMDKIELSNPAMQQLIDRYKKGVIKGDAESMNLLGMECMSGKNVKSNMEMGLNLLDAAAKQNNLDAQYNLGNYFFLFWLKKPDNDAFFSQGIKWLKKAVKAGDARSIIMLARFYNEYGKYKKEPSYIDGGIKLLETYPKVSEVSQKDEAILDVQALIGSTSMEKWRLDNDTAAVLNAKKWYRILLQSKLEFPNYSNYIDSLKEILAMGIPMRIDPMPTPEEIEESKKPAAGMGGFPGGFGGGGFPGGGAPGGAPGRAPGGAPAQQGPAPIQATYLGGMQQMQQYIRNNTLYPESLKAQKQNGRVTVSFTVDTDGAVINPKVTNSAEVPFMNQEALRVVMTMPDWIPAQDENGKPVQAQHTATVTFGNGGMGGFGGGFGF
jgi:TonB family C-terminal domain